MEQLTGIVVAVGSDKGLPYATVQMAGSRRGSISDEEGRFQLNLVPRDLPDTLTVSFIGYETYKVAIDGVTEHLSIELVPAINLLKEVVVRPLSPEDYLKVVRRKVSINYASDPYELTSYYREQAKENGAFIKHHEGAFRSVVTGLGASKKQQHQLLLYRQADNIKELEFMRDKIEKRRAKEAEKKGEELVETSELLETTFGGPQMILSLDVAANDLPFLDTTQFHKFRYEYGDETTYNGKDLVAIRYRSKGSVKYVKPRGTLYIDKKSDAIVAMVEQGQIVIPLAVEPLLFVLGFGIKQPRYTAELRYQEIDGKWYPQNIQWSVNIGLVKKKMFKKNERSDFHIEQIMVVNDVDRNDPVPISKEYQFDHEEKMEGQVHNDQGLRWDQVNVLP